MSAYRWDAAEYARHSAAQQTWALELLDKLHLHGTEDLLDLGCGDGKITAMIARTLSDGTVLGVDSSAEMIAYAQQTFAHADHPNLRFEQADARDLAYAAAFDVVFSNAALHWIVDHRAVLCGIERSLRAGGRLLVQMGGQGNGAQIIAAMDEVRQRPQWRPYFSDWHFPYGFYAVPEYTTLLHAAGLTPLRVELLEKDMPHTGRAGLMTWIRTAWLPYTERIACAEREHFIAAVANAFLHAHPADANGTVHVRMLRLEVEATKPHPA